MTLYIILSMNDVVVNISVLRALMKSRTVSDEDSDLIITIHGH